MPGSIFAPALRATTLGLLVVITMIAFEAMAVFTALPTAARDLHGLAAFGWAFTGFLVANVVGMVLAGGLADAGGPRIPLTAGLVVFPAGLAIAGSATTMAQLVAGRVVQGLGGGLLITAAYVVIGQVYPEQLRPRVFAATSSAWVVPAAVGPLVAGALTQDLSWRWVFFGLLPFVLAGGLLLVPVLRSMATADFAGWNRRDRSRIGLAVVVAAGVATLENAGQHPSVASIAVAAVGLVALVGGLRALLPPGTFAVRPGVSAPVAVRGLCAGAFFGIEAGIPLSLSVQHHYSATLAGLPLTCAGVSWTAGSWWQGRAQHAGDLRYRSILVRIGFGLIAAAAVLVALADQPGLPAWLIYPAWLTAGGGAGLVISSAGVLLLLHTSDAQRGTHSAALQLSDATASAVTTGVAGVLVAAAAHASLGYTTAFTVLAAAMGAIALLGSSVSGRLRRPVAAPTFVDS